VLATPAPIIGFAEVRYAWCDFVIGSREFVRFFMAILFHALVIPRAIREAPW